MTATLIVLFWTSLALLLLPFVLYRIGISLLARLKPRPIRRETPTEAPMVTFVMAAFNEEEIIAERIENFLNLDYPVGKLRFLIGSDASTDRTDEIVRRYENREPSVALTRFEKSGKTRIVYDLARPITRGIIIFTDADALLEPSAVAEMVACFSDPDVGGVVVNVGYREREENAGSIGERSYHSAENRVRRAESLVDSTLGPTGQCFAVRPEAYTELEDVRMSDDLNLAITVRLNGYRVWFEPKARVLEVNRRTLASEFQRRTRMGRQSMATYRGYRQTRWPWQSSTALKLWLHKIPRNLSGLSALFVGIFAVLLAIEGAGPIYLGFAIAGALWLLLVGIGFVVESTGHRLRILAYPLYFSAMIVALTIGSLRAIRRGSGLAEWSSPRISATNRLK